MKPLAFHRYSSLRVVTMSVVSAFVVLLPPFLPMAWAHVLAPSNPSFDDLMVRADHQHAAGSYAESADLYGQAYRARPEEKRADQIGEVTLRSAMAAYDLASPEQTDLALLEAEAQLLDEFLTARKQAQAAAVAKKVPQVPQDLVDELERLNGRIAELREAERRAAEVAAKAESEAQPEPTSAPIHENGPVPPEPAPERGSIRRSDGAILGVGVVSFVGGMGLVTIGAVNSVKTNKAADNALAALAVLAEDPRLDDEQEQNYRTSVDEWQKNWRNVSTAMVVSGAVLGAAGIGLTSWGIVRTKKHRSSFGSRAALIPTGGRGQLGLQLVAKF